MSAEPVSPPPLPQNIAAIVAPTALGMLFNWCLFGVLTVQVYIYARSFKADKTWMKTLVYTIFLIETAQTALTGADMYYWFVTGYGNLSRFTKSYLSPIDIPLFAAIISLIVQVFFCHRIYGLQKSFWPICALIFLISLMQASCALYGAVTGLIANSGVHEAEVNQRIVIAWLSGTAIADTIIAAMMILLLIKFRKEEFHHSIDIMTRIVRLTVETNAVTSSVAIITIIVFLVHPDTSDFYTPTAVMGKLYSNTLLVTFNNRIALREVLPSVISGSLGGPPTLRSSVHPASGEAIKMETFSDVESGHSAVMDINRKRSLFAS
ncbi:MAG: hypothetical protein NXY57DRAFT_1014645 [Lentinula lateritia]|nr:MAG: hypothetical protein NXY57DRAFT_1014645 [Lentinula lateritia]